MHWSQKVKELKKLVTDSILIMLQYVKIVVELLLRKCKGTLVQTATKNGNYVNTGYVFTKIIAYFLNLMPRPE